MNKQSPWLGVGGVLEQGLEIWIQACKWLHELLDGDEAIPSFIRVLGHAR